MGLALGEGEGEARDLVWCPRGGTLETGEKMEVDDSSENDQLGVLAGVFTDGKVKVFVVPKPETVREKQGKEDSEVVYRELTTDQYRSLLAGAHTDPFLLTVKAKKVLELSLPDTSCLSFAWGSWETIAAGCVNGEHIRFLPFQVSPLTMNDDQATLLFGMSEMLYEKVTQPVRFQLYSRAISRLTD